MSTAAFTPTEAYFTDSPYGFLNFARGVREQDRAYENQRLIQESTEEVQREGLTQQKREFSLIYNENIRRRISADKENKFRRDLASRQQNMIEEFAKRDRITAAANQKTLFEMERKRLALSELEQREGSEARADTLRLRAELQEDQDEYNDEQQRLYREQFAFYQEIQASDLSLREELGRGDLALREELGRGQLDLGRDELSLRGELGREDLALRGELGRGSLSLQEELGRGSLNLDRQRFRESQNQFNLTFEENQYQFDQRLGGGSVGSGSAGQGGYDLPYDWAASFTGRRTNTTAEQSGYRWVSDPTAATGGYWSSPDDQQRTRETRRT